MEKNLISVIYILCMHVFFIFFLYKKKNFLKIKNNYLFFLDYVINFFCLVFLLLLLYFLLKNYFLLENFTDLRDNSSINTAFAYLKNIDPFSKGYYVTYANLYSLIYP